LGRQLDFPDWYGANLDALSDCLTDFSWREAQGYIITLSGADALQVLPDSFATLNAVFASAIEQWQDQGVPFWVFYEFGSTEVTAGLASLPVINLQ
jgi:RNAse (barnase) inhibitor barstar